jgi:hypothetical protein
MITNNGINIQSLRGKSGIQFSDNWLRKLKIKHYPVTGYYAQLAISQNSMTDSDGNLIEELGTPKWLQLIPYNISPTSPFKVNTFLTSDIHRISFKFDKDRSSVTSANGNTYDLLLLYAFDDLEIYVDNTRLNAIISSLNPTTIDEDKINILSKLQERYLCGAIKFSSLIRFSNINTIIDLSSYVIPQCSFKCLTEPGLNNVSHYIGDYLKLNNFYDDNVNSNQFIFKETAQYYIDSKLSTEAPSNQSLRIRKSGLIEY